MVGILLNNIQLILWQVILSMPPNYVLLSVILVFLVVLIPISHLFKISDQLLTHPKLQFSFPGTCSPFSQLQREPLQADNAGNYSTRISQAPLCFHCHLPGHFLGALIGTDKFFLNSSFGIGNQPPRHTSSPGDIKRK